MNFSLYLRDRYFLLYVVKFALAFCFFYFTTIAVIGLSAPGNLYSGIIDHYFDYVKWLRVSLLYGSKYLLGLFGYDTYVLNQFRLKMNGGHGVRIVYSCLGYGIMSFWIAFIFANKGTLTKKFQWILYGLLLIWLINIVRLSLLLVAGNKHWGFPFFNHHTWFNIAAYTSIFVLIYFYDKSSKVNQRVLKKAN